MAPLGRCLFSIAPTVVAIGVWLACCCLCLVCVSSAPSAKELLQQGRAALAAGDFGTAQSLLGLAVRVPTADSSPGGRQGGGDGGSGGGRDDGGGLSQSTEAWQQLLLAHAKAGDYAAVVRLKTNLSDLRVECCDAGLPTLHYLIGVSHYNLGHLQQAAVHFDHSLRSEPDDVESWFALGDSLLHNKDPEAAALPYEEAVQRNLTTDVSPLLMARAWVCDWRRRGEHEALLRRRLAAGESDDAAAAGDDRASSGARALPLPRSLQRSLLRTHSDESLDLPAADFLRLNRARRTSWLGPPAERPAARRQAVPAAIPPAMMRRSSPRPAVPLRVGFLTAGLGVHPVVTSIRGVLAGLGSTSSMAAPATTPPARPDPLSREAPLEVFVYVVGTDGVEGWTPDPATSAAVEQEEDGRSGDRPRAFTGASSWWAQNVTGSLPPGRISLLHGMSASQAAQRIRGDGIHVLVELDGRTVNSGLPILALRPAPVQVSFLGYALSTGSDHVDYFVGDRAATSPDLLAGAFSERLILMPHSYLPTDYSALQGHVLWGLTAAHAAAGKANSSLLRSSSSTTTELLPTSSPLPQAATGGHHGWWAAAALSARRRTLLEKLMIGAGWSRDDAAAAAAAPAVAAALTGGGVTGTAGKPAKRRRGGRWTVYATFSNFRKIDPAVMSAWVQVLLRTGPRSVLVLLAHTGYKKALANLRAEAASAGVEPRRLLVLDRLPWIDHLRTKAALPDLVLDTTLKNGHTSLADALWAGLPVLTLAGRRMGNRVGMSMAAALGCPELVVRSFKDYVDVAVRVGTGQQAVNPAMGDLLTSRGPLLLARGLKRKVRRLRAQAALFRGAIWNRAFKRQLQAAWEIEALGASSAGGTSGATGANESGVLDKQRDSRRYHLVAVAQCGSSGLGKRSSSGKVNGGPSPSCDRQWEPLQVNLEYPDDRHTHRFYGTAPPPTTPTSGARPRNFTTSHSDSEPDFETSGMDDSLLIGRDERPVLLHIGGIEHRAGWQIINVNPDLESTDAPRPAGGADLAGRQQARKMDKGDRRGTSGTDMRNLGAFGNSSVSAIYASHVLEHTSHREETLATLREWHRVLKPGGLLAVSVPDLRMLAKLVLDDSLSVQERLKVVAMIYGAHQDAHDMHYNGFDAALLGAWLQTAGFCQLVEVSDFGLFNDTSLLAFRGTRISLNVRARACKPDGSPIHVELPKPFASETSFERPLVVPPEAAEIN